MAVRETYKLQDGTVVPSVTTVLGRFKESGGLLWWANQQGLAGKTLEEARVPAATAGTMAHDMVEAKINGRELPTLIGDADVVNKAKSAFAVYENWQSMSHLVIKHTEVSLVSETYRFGGRLDAMGTVNDVLCLVDWKTSNAIYSDYILQLAAYGLLWEENYPEHPIVGGYHLIRFAKEEGDFSHHYFPKLNAEREAFTVMVDLYRRVKDIDRRVK
jgi:hypothetical protein